MQSSSGGVVVFGSAEVVGIVALMASSSGWQEATRQLARKYI